MAHVPIAAIISNLSPSSPKLELRSPETPSPSAALEQRVERMDKDMLCMEEALTHLLRSQVYGEGREATPVGFSQRVEEEPAIPSCEMQTGEYE